MIAEVKMFPLAVRPWTLGAALVSLAAPAGPVPEATTPIPPTGSIYSSAVAAGADSEPDVAYDETNDIFLVVWGREDEIIPLNACRLYQEAIKGAKAQILDHCGHIPEMEKPEEFVKVVLDFLR